jgi:hypothetical protein
MLLMLATWPLWFPGTSPDFPMIPLLPLIPSGSSFGTWVGQLLAVAVLTGLAAVLLLPERCRSVWWLIAGSLVGSFLLDQHRLQPWAYQSSIYAMVFASMDRATARRWLIPLAASIYIYSAAGKLDYQFTHTVGQEFLAAVADHLGGLLDGATESRRVQLALLFPTVELIAGMSVLFRRTRRAGAVVLMAMHIGLLAILGPWNRDHSHGVLLWNVLLIAQAYLLLFQEPPFGADEPGSDRRQPASFDSRVVASVVRMIVILAIAAPVLERRGYWDHWTSWSLYSPHTSHVDIEIHRSVFDRLPDSAQAYLRHDTDGDGWSLLDLGRWSLAARRVPVYPQARYQLAVASELARQLELTDEIRAHLAGASDRWTGKRTQRLMRNRAEIDKVLREFWCRPRLDQ